MTQTPNHDPLLDKIAATLKQQGLHATALAFLEAGQPLAFIGSQLLWLAQPALTLLWPKVDLGQLAAIMEEPTAVRALMHRLATDEAAV